jgi:hypothetical protein
MTAKIQVRRDTTTNWNAGTPPILDVGEIGLDTTLKQIKIGNGSSNWAALPWLAGTFPVYASPSSIDLNDSSNSVQGVYRFTSGFALTNAPASPINIVATDGGATMLVIVVDSHVVQQLWTDGDGSTQVPKSYSRVYDNGSPAWRPWTPQNSWGISATEGVELVAKSITLKATGTGLTVDGNSTLTGDVTVNGTTTLGNNNLDVVTVYAGSVTAPIITTNGDLNTGIYFPAADQVAVTANGVQQLLLNSTPANVLAAVFRAGATFNERLDMNSHRILELGTATSLTDALSLSGLLDRVCLVWATANGSVTGSNGTTWTVAGTGLVNTAVTFTPTTTGTYDYAMLCFTATALLPAVSKVGNAIAVPTSNAVPANTTSNALLIAIQRS